MRLPILRATICLAVVASHAQVHGRSLIEVVANGEEFAGHVIHDFDNESPGPIINNNRDILALGRVFDPATGDQRNVTFLSNYGFDLKSGATTDDGLSVRFSDEDLAFDMNQSGQVATTTELHRNGEFLSGGLLINRELILQGSANIDGRAIVGVDDRNVRINAAQQVLFHADLEANGKHALGVFTLDRAVVVEGDRLRDGLVTQLRSSFLNDVGQIAANVTLESGDQFGAVLVDGEVVVKKGDIIDGVEVNRLNLVGFNSNGDVLFQNENFIMTQDRILVDTSNQVSQVHVQDFSNRGDVLWATETALYVNNDAIVQVGDSILGHSITRVLEQQSASINDFGDVVFVPETGTSVGIERLLVSVADREFPHGDFDQDGTLTANDIDSLSEHLRTESGNIDFDVNLDRRLTGSDREQWIQQVAKTYKGDSNLDGVFNSADFVLIFSAGEYEDDIPGNSGWATGDWNGDGDFTSGDFVAAFSYAGYEIGRRNATARGSGKLHHPVPEPTGAAALAAIIFCIASAGRSRENSV